MWGCIARRVDAGTSARLAARLHAAHACCGRTQDPARRISAARRTYQRDERTAGRRCAAQPASPGRPSVSCARLGRGLECVRCVCGVEARYFLTSLGLGLILSSCETVPLSRLSMSIYSLTGLTYLLVSVVCGTGGTASVELEDLWCGLERCARARGCARSARRDYLRAISKCYVLRGCTDVRRDERVQPGVGSYDASTLGDAS